MTTWTVTMHGVPEYTHLTGSAADHATATADAADALETVLAHHDGLDHRRYVLTIDGALTAILVTGRDHQHADPASLTALVAAIRRTDPRP